MKKSAILLIILVIIFVQISLVNSLREYSAKFVRKAAVLNGIHDAGIYYAYSSSVNGIRIVQNESIINGSDRIVCNKSFTILFKVKNYGNFNETVNASGSINGFNWQQALFNLTSGVLSSERRKTVSYNFLPGFYNISISLFIPIDNNLLNNFASRQIEVACPECYSDNDCKKGDDLAIIKRNYDNYTCAVANNWCEYADINQDMKVNFLDLGILATKWHENCSQADNWCNRADINRDGQIIDTDLMRCENPGTLDARCSSFN